MSEYLPSGGIIILSILFSSARFEIQRRIRARALGLMDSNKFIGLFVDLTGVLSLVFATGFLAAYVYDEGYTKVLVLIAITTVAGWISSLVFGLIFKGNSPFFWIPGTLGVWVVAVFLYSRVTWFSAL